MMRLNEKNLKLVFKAKIQWYDLSTRLKIKLNFNFIFWIRFEVLLKANIKGYISRVSS
jgi:hypothetical protein